MKRTIAVSNAFDDAAMRDACGLNAHDCLVPAHDALSRPRQHRRTAVAIESGNDVHFDDPCAKLMLRGGLADRDDGASVGRDGLEA